MINSVIVDGTGTEQAAKVKSDHTRISTGLVTYTHPVEEYNNIIRYFTNNTYGNKLNINAAATGTPDNVHNGTDNTYWTATALSGVWVFNSTTQAHTGTKSIDGTGTKHLDEAQFERASNIDLASYVSIAAYIYIVSWPVTGKNITIRFRLAGADVSNAINISEYVNINTTGVWQVFNIPFEDFTFTSTTVDQVVIQTIATGAGNPVNFYLDDIKVEEVGGAIQYLLEPDNSKVWLLDKVNFKFIDNINSLTTISGSTQTATLANLSYNKFLGVAALSNGFIFRRYRKDNIIANFNAKQLSDMYGIGETKITDLFSDGTNTFMNISVSFNPPMLIEEIFNDRLSIIIADDLSGLIDLEVYCNIREVIDISTF